MMTVESKQVGREEHRAKLYRLRREAEAEYLASPLGAAAFEKLEQRLTEIDRALTLLMRFF